MEHVIICTEKIFSHTKLKAYMVLRITYTISVSSELGAGIDI